MDTAHQWPQIVVKPIEQIVTTNTAPSSSSFPKQQQVLNNGGLDHQIKNNNNKVMTRPQKEQAPLNCPRCNSTNTKFCYYNNYSLTQPRYFCKTCRRYWTNGGSLRNIPVGGGSRKNKRPSISSSSPISSKTNNNNKLPDLVSSYQNPKNNNIVHDHAGQDLNLSFLANSRVGNFTSFLTSTTSVPVQDHYTSGFSLQEFKTPSLGFSLDGLGNGGFGSSHDLHQESSSGGRLLFPFEDLKQIQSSTNENRDQQGDVNISSSGFWSGMMGGGAGGSW